MQGEDRSLAEAVKRSAPPDSGAPAFDAVWATAEARSRRPRRRHAAIAAGFAIIAGFIALNLDDAPIPSESSLTEELMSSTHWSPPSDALLPQYDLDVYRDLPALDTSTDVDDGALL